MEEEKKKVLCYLDGSGESRRALKWALRFFQPDIMILVCAPKLPPSAILKTLALGAFLCPQAQLCTETLSSSKEKGKAIVEKAQEHNVRWLILGQKKMRMVPSMLHCLRLLSGHIKDDLRNYCFENFEGRTLGVRKKKDKNYKINLSHDHTAHVSKSDTANSTESLPLWLCYCSPIIIAKIDGSSQSMAQSSDACLHDNNTSDGSHSSEHALVHSYEEHPGAESDDDMLEYKSTTDTSSTEQEIKLTQKLETYRPSSDMAQVLSPGILTTTHEELTVTGISQTSSSTLPDSPPAIYRNAEPIPQTNPPLLGFVTSNSEDTCPSSDENEEDVIQPLILQKKQQLTLDKRLLVHMDGSLVSYAALEWAVRYFEVNSIFLLASLCLSDNALALMMEKCESLRPQALVQMELLIKTQENKGLEIVQLAGKYNATWLVPGQGCESNYLFQYCNHYCHCMTVGVREEIGAQRYIISMNEKNIKLINLHSMNDASTENFEFNVEEAQVNVSSSWNDTHEGFLSELDAIEAVTEGCSFHNLSDSDDDPVGCVHGQMSMFDTSISTLSENDHFGEVTQANEIGGLNNIDAHSVEDSCVKPCKFHTDNGISMKNFEFGEVIEINDICGTNDNSDDCIDELHAHFLSTEKKNSHVYDCILEHVLRILLRWIPKPYICIWIS